MGCPDKPGNDRLGGVHCMKFNKKNLGSSLEDFLNEEGILADATIYAIKSVIALQLGEEMKNKKNH